MATAYLVFAGRIEDGLGDGSLVSANLALPDTQTIAEIQAASKTWVEKIDPLTTGYFSNLRIVIDVPLPTDIKIKDTPVVMASRVMNVVVLDFESTVFRRVFGLAIPAFNDNLCPNGVPDLSAADTLALAAQMLAPVAGGVYTNDGGHPLTQLQRGYSTTRIRRKARDRQRYPVVPAEPTIPVVPAAPVIYQLAPSGALEYSGNGGATWTTLLQFAPDPARTAPKAVSSLDTLSSPGTPAPVLLNAPGGAPMRNVPLPLSGLPIGSIGNPSFRLTPAGAMEYSEDEGTTWTVLLQFSPNTDLAAPVEFSPGAASLTGGTSWPF